MISFLLILVINLITIYFITKTTKSIKSYLNISTETMIQLNQNSLKDFIKEIERHEKEYHQYLDPVFKKGYTPGRKSKNHVVHGTETLGRLDNVSPLKEKKNKRSIGATKAWETRRRKAALLKRKQLSVDAHNALIRPGDVTIQ